MQLFCMALMACGACVFGLILGELQEIYATANTRTRQLDDHMESVVTFLNQNRFARVRECTRPLDAVRMQNHANALTKEPTPTMARRARSRSGVALKCHT